MVKVMDGLVKVGVYGCQIINNMVARGGQSSFQTVSISIIIQVDMLENL